MKNKILSLTTLVAFVLVTATSNVSARSWRINNNESRRANFLDINAACASEEVMNGDTLYLDPGCSISSEQTVTKRLTIIGTGYFLTNQPYAAASIAAKLNLNAVGIKVTGIIASNIYINANNITVERCKAGTIYIGDNGNESKYAQIRQCYCAYLRAKQIAEKYGFCTIENCMIVGVSRDSEATYSIRELYSPTIRNNFVKCINDGSFGRTCMGRFSYGTITNNIICMVTENQHNRVFTSLTNCTVTNNLLSCDENAFPDYPNNVCLGTHDITSIFTCTGANDRYYEMAEDSPAKAIEAGPFYGAHPYVFSGFPYGHPYYTSVNVSPRAKDGKIHFTINSKLQDE